MPTTLPGWLLKRARECGGGQVLVLLDPATPRSSAMYLLETSDHSYELHVVDDAQSGIDGTTIPLTRREVTALLHALAGGLSGRLAWEGVRPLPPLPVDAPPVEDRGPIEGIACDG